MVTLINQESSDTWGAASTWLTSKKEEMNIIPWMRCRKYIDEVYLPVSPIYKQTLQDSWPKKRLEISTGHWFD